MTHFVLSDDRQRSLVFYLAMEEYVARAYGEGFFVWSVEPTVIFGRNQDMEAEVNIEFCRQHGIRMFRRRSGGGCVYADRGNLMISCITPGRNIETSFGEYLEKLASLLRRMGFAASRTSHNDVLVGDRKVSGNACFAAGSSVIVHGTLLYDTDFNMMQSAITPSREKLESHGVKSVRQRVANLCELGVVPDLKTLCGEIITGFCDSCRALSGSEVSEIEAMERTYLDPAFISGRH